MEGGLIAADLSSPDGNLIGLLVIILNLFLFVFFVYIFPFFVYFISGKTLYGTLKVVTLFMFSSFVTICLAFLAAYTISFDSIFSVVAAAFILYTITGLALISGYSISEHRYPKDHKWIPYLISSLAASGYILYFFGFALKNPFNIHSYILIESSGFENVFHEIYLSSGLFADYYTNASLGLSYLGYFLEIFIISAVLCFVVTAVIGSAGIKE